MSAGPRILVVRVGAMGDVLHGMPAVAALRAALPAAHLAWAVEPRWASLLSTQGAHVWEAEQPLVDAVHLVEAKAWSKQPLSLATLHSIRALRHALRAERYDLAIDLQGTLRSAVITRMSGAPRVVGSDRPRERPALLFYTHRVPVQSAHVVEQVVEVVSAAVNLSLQPAPVLLPHDAAVERWCDALLAGDTRPTVLLAPTAGWGAKEWPANHFGQVAAALHALGCRVLVNAAPAGPDAVVQQVLAASGNTAQPAACTLPQLVALVRRASLVIAGDTGPLHLAAALRVPVVALFGPTDPLRNGPYGTAGLVLRHPDSRTDHRRHSETERGLCSITPDEVLAAVRQLLPGLRERAY